MAKKKQVQEAASAAVKKGFNLGNIEWMSHYDKKIYTN